MSEATLLVHVVGSESLCLLKTIRETENLLFHDAGWGGERKVTETTRWTTQKEVNIFAMQAEHRNTAAEAKTLGLWAVSEQAHFADLTGRIGT